MKICVVNGSPKGRYSVTLQTALYLEKRFPEHTFAYLDVGQKIKAYEKDLSGALTALQEAELVLFSYPVYTFLAPSQLHRFIELLKASGAELSGKYATQITTSKHFYDVTAHRYVEDNCHDLGLNVIHGLSADMDDLLTEAGRRDAAAFLRYAAFCVENGVCEPRPAAAPRALPPYAPALPASPKKDGFDTVIVADLREADGDLRAMIDDFRQRTPTPRAW